MSNDNSFINSAAIEETIEKSMNPGKKSIRKIIDRALDLKGLSLEETAQLICCSDPDILQKVFDAAQRVKDMIYGDRLVLFAPLYISNLCQNECLYCAFRASNWEIHRRWLNQAQIQKETELLVQQGHKRILLVAGEAFPPEGLDYILDAIDSIYKVRSGKGKIRRINVNIAPLEVEEFRRLKEKGIGTYQVFQETYHRETYGKMHPSGKKSDYDWRLYAPDRAMQGGIDDVGIGVLFGLYDYRFEVLALMQHIRHLEETYGVGPHTISVPRIEPACGSDISTDPPYPVTDDEFKKIVAVLRLAVPYTGIIMSTRETAEMRRETFALGVSQISAGSRTNPGGYSARTKDAFSGQFYLGDCRSLDEVIRDISTLGYVPSFCTACYRLGRTGQDFMDLAKPGEIKHHCGVNALSTFQEFLLDYATPQTREVGEELIRAKLESTEDNTWKTAARKLVEEVINGHRDCFV